DLTCLEVYWEGHPAGQAIPFILGRMCIAMYLKPSHAPITTTTYWTTRPTTPTTGRRLNRRRTTQHDARTLGHPLRLHPHAVLEEHPGQGPARASESSGGGRPHPLLHRRIDAGPHHRRGRRRQD